MPTKKYPQLDARTDNGEVTGPLQPDGRGVTLPHVLATTMTPTNFAAVFAGTPYVIPGYFNTPDYVRECARLLAEHEPLRFASPRHMAALGAAPSRSRQRRITASTPNQARDQARRDAMERLLLGNSRRAGI